LKDGQKKCVESTQLRIAQFRSNLVLSFITMSCQSLHYKRSRSKVEVTAWRNVQWDRSLRSLDLETDMSKIRWKTVTMRWHQKTQMKKTHVEYYLATNYKLCMI